MTVQSRFNFLLNLPGKIFRKQPARLTKAAQLEGQNVFVKLHFGIGFKEIFKNLFQGRLPILGARTEYVALKKLAEIGVLSLEVIEFGEWGVNPANQHSYLVTKALTGVTSLENLCALWNETPPSVKFKRALIRAVAVIARTIHTHGLNHRDFYLCHFLLDEAHYAQQQKIKLFLIDLHRAQIRQKTPWRWRVKDIAGLYFSALNCSLNRRDLFCFMKEYREDSVSLWNRVEEKAWVLYEKTYFKKIHGVFKTVVYDPRFDKAELQNFLFHPDRVMAQGKILKDDATTTVTKLSFQDTAKSLVIKRYNVRNMVKGIKRFFKSSRARRCWLQALRLRHLGIHTPEPIAMMERVRFGLLRESYVVTEYLKGQDLFSFLHEHPKRAEEVAIQMQVIFKTLEAIYTAHGDFKASNLWVVENKIYLLDLDGVKQYVNLEKLHRALAKDKQRFLKNWANEQNFYKVFYESIS